MAVKASGDRLCGVLQVVLINAVKDVAKALANLISTTKAAAGKPYDDPSMLQLKSSAKVSPRRVENPPCSSAGRRQPQEGARPVLL